MAFSSSITVNVDAVTDETIANATGDVLFQLGTSLFDEVYRLRRHAYRAQAALDDAHNAALSIQHAAGAELTAAQERMERLLPLAMKATAKFEAEAVTHFGFRRRRPAIDLMSCDSWDVIDDAASVFDVDNWSNAETQTETYAADTDATNASFDLLTFDDCVAEDEQHAAGAELTAAQERMERLLPLAMKATAKFEAEAVTHFGFRRRRPAIDLMSCDSWDVIDDAASVFDVDNWSNAETQSETYAADTDATNASFDLLTFDDCVAEDERPAASTARRPPVSPRPSRPSSAKAQAHDFGKPIDDVFTAHNIQRAALHDCEVRLGKLTFRNAYWVVLRQFRRDLTYIDLRRFKLPLDASHAAHCSIALRYLSNIHLHDFTTPDSESRFAVKMLATALADRNVSIGALRILRSMDAIFGRGMRLAALELSIFEHELVTLVKTTDFFQMPTIQGIKSLKLELEEPARGSDAPRRWAIVPPSLWIAGVHLLQNSERFEVSYYSSRHLRTIGLKLVQLCEKFERGEISEVVQQFKFATSGRVAFPFKEDNTTASGVVVGNYEWDVYRFRNAATGEWLTACVGHGRAKYSHHSVVHIVKGDPHPDAPFAAE